MIRLSQRFAAAGVVVCAAIAVATGCTTGAPPTGSAAGPDSEAAARSGRTYVYECAGANRLTVRVEGETAWLFLASGTARLPHVRSASGAKFSDGASTYWSKGEQASFVLPGRTYPGCRNNRALAIWEDAKFRGVDFRAVGNEPGWHLEIFDGEKVVFTHNYGQERHEFSFVPPMSDPASRTSRYQLRNAGHSLLITLAGRSCSDSMSGESFQTHVALLFDGIAYAGCGRALH